MSAIGQIANWAALSAFATLSFAHSGALDRNGGHLDSSTGLYHCHTEECAIESSCELPNSLEINVINIGQGDATLVAGPNGLLLADAGETNWNNHKDAEKIHEVLTGRYGENCRVINYVLISHFHLDHIGYISAEYDAKNRLLNDQGKPHRKGDSLGNPKFLGGLAYLVRGLEYRIGKLLLRDYESHNPNRLPEHRGSKTYWNWRAFLASPEGSAFNPTTTELGQHQVDLGTVNGKPIRIDVVQVDGATPNNPNGCDPLKYFGGAQNGIRGIRNEQEIVPSENDLSTAFIVSLGRFQMFIGGDTSGFNDVNEKFGYQYHDTESCLAQDQIVQNTYGGHLEVLRVSHHGSSHSTNPTFLDAFNPRVSIVSAGDENTYGHPTRQVLDRLLNMSDQNDGAVILTEIPPWYDQNNTDSLCLVGTAKQGCAHIADGELDQANADSDEAGDAGVLIRVANDGTNYSIQTREGISGWEFASE